MSSSQTTFMGIVPLIQGDLIAYAVVSYGLKPMAIGADELDGVVAVVEDWRPEIIAVGAPPRLNQGIVIDPQKRIEWGISPQRGRPMDCRVGEYELLQRGYNIYRTPSQTEKTKPWMQTGFRLFERLEKIGFRAYTEAPDGKQLIETPAETCFWMWLEGKPLAADTFEGRLQRQLVLYEQGLDIPDPMLLLEEITRHRLLQGSLLEEGLYTPEELQALAAATIAWAVSHRPEEITFIGDEEEGRVTVPK